MVASIEETFEGLGLPTKFFMSLQRSLSQLP
jgi:hypothetical protein